MMGLIQVREENGVAHVRMNRPDVRNAFNPDMIEDLTKLFLSLEKRRDLRLITFAGEGKAFSAGADLSWMKTVVTYSFEQNREDSLRLHAMFDAFSKCTIPVIGLAHGSAFGGALGLLSCCDHVVAEASTQFSFSEVKLGIAPAVISEFVLRKANASLARSLMVSGRIFDAQIAHQLGVAHEIVAEGQGSQALDAAVVMWLEAGPEAARATKKLLNDLEVLPAAEKRDRTTNLIAELRVGSEGQEGLKSFLEKRKPSWRLS